MKDIPVLEFIRLRIYPAAHPDKLCVCDFKHMPESSDGLMAMVKAINQMESDYVVTVTDVLYALFGSLLNYERWAKAILSVEPGRN